jgi:hypothetical protein
VVAYGPDAAARGYELDVYDVVDLRLRRTVPLEPRPGREFRDLECVDASAETVRLPMDSGPHGDQLRVVVRGAATSDEPVPAGNIPLSQRLWHDDGSRVVEISHDDPRVNYEAADPLPLLQGVVIDRDGRTAAGYFYGSEERDYRKPTAQIVVFDASTGQVRARWNPGDSVNQVAWGAAGNLVARIGYSSSYPGPYRVGQVVRLDRGLRVLGRDPGVPGGTMTVLGGSAVFYFGSRIAAVTADHRTLVVQDLRLPATQGLLPLTDATFTPPRGSPAEAAAPSGVATDRTAVAVLVGPGLAVAALVAGVRMVGRAAGRR